MKEANAAVERMSSPFPLNVPWGLENVDELQATFTGLKVELQNLIRAGNRNHALSARIKQIDSALERLKTGTYGVCRSCFLVMPKSELLRNPFREECSGCRQKREGRLRK